MLNKKLFWLVFAIALPLFSLSAVLSALAAPNDTHTVCASGCDFSSIQAAINAAISGDTLSLAGETFTEPFTVSKSLTIQGAGTENTILQAAESQALATSRVISVTEGVTITISGVTIRYGKVSGTTFPDGYGAGIFSQGTLNVSQSAIVSNTATYAAGLYIDEGGSANIVDATFSGNICSATYGCAGGIHANQVVILNVSNSTFLRNTGNGIYIFDSTALNVSDSDFISNQTNGTYIQGRGIQISGSTAAITGSTFQSNQGNGINILGESTATVTGSTFQSNQDSSIGISGESTATITGCIFQSNTTPNSGGGISVYSFSHLILSDSTFEGNQAGDSGGAIRSSQHGDLVITNVTFEGNTADFGAGIYNYNHGTISISNVTFEGNIGAINGGGFYNSGDSVAVLTNTTFYSNSASSYGGRIYNYNGSRLDVSNSTINGNTAGESGAGIHNFQVATLTVTNVTIAGNSADLNGGGISNEFFSVLNLSGSIIAGSLSGGDCFNETGSEHGTVFDFGYNIVEDGSCIAASTSFAADPLLGPLQDNGGATHTQALLEGSPALDAIPPAACAVTEDQRGVVRPQDEGCEIGAFELEGEAAQPRIFLPIVVR